MWYIITVIFSLFILYIIKTLKCVYNDEEIEFNNTSPLYVWIISFVLCFIPILNIVFYFWGILRISHEIYKDIEYVTNINSKTIKVIINFYRLLDKIIDKLKKEI